MRKFIKRRQLAESLQKFTDDNEEAHNILIMTGMAGSGYVYSHP
jgi:hypothetical protein